MPKTTLFWLLTYFTLLFGSFVNPLFGTLGYMFEYYLRPALNWWGRELPDLRWNLMISAVLVGTYLMRRQFLPNVGRARRGPGTILVVLLLVMVLVYPIAVNKSESWRKTTDYSKMILFHGLMVGTVRTELAFDAVVAMHMAGAAWWGWEAYRNPKRSSGRLSNVGSGDTRGDNAAAAHLLTVVPFLAVYLAMHRDKRLRILALIGMPLVLNTIILCNSRGATLGMIAAGLAGLWFAKSGHRIRMIGAAVLLGIAVLMLADPQFLERQRFSREYGTDGSAQGRVDSWRGGLNLIADYPFGAGGQGYDVLSPIYIPDIVEELGSTRAPHNTLVLVAAEWGILGLLLFFSYYWSVFRLLAEVRKKAVSALWYYRSVAIQLGMIGLFVAGIFTDRLYAEAPYWMGALGVALHRIHAHKLQSATAATTSVQAPVAAARAQPPLRRAV